MNIEYLNRFLQRSWPSAAALIKSEIIHSAKVKSDDRGFDLHVWQTSLDLSVPPAFSESGNSLTLRFPKQEKYKLSTKVEKHIEYSPNITLPIYIEIWAEMTFGAGTPLINVHVGVWSNPLADTIDWFNNWKSELEEQIKSDFAKHLGFFNSGRYQPSTITSSDQPVLIHGLRELDNNKAIDIVLVADGVMTNNRADFDAVAEAFKNTLTTPTNSHVNEPFLSFDSVIRLWKIHAPATIPSVTRVVTHYQDVDTNTNKTCLANLAQLADIGLNAERSGMDVIVFMSDRTTMGVDNARAMTMGNLIMLPVSKNKADKDSSTLIHELGHSVLGGLSDEYVEHETRYKGNVPETPNLSREKANPNLTKPAKWAKWMQHPELLPAWDRNNKIKTVESAGGYRFGLYRPAENCKMKDAHIDVAFCAVCRESITRHIRSILGTNYFLIEVMNTNLNEVSRMQVDENSHTHIRVRLTEDGISVFGLQILACSLPKPWKISFDSTGIVGGRFQDTQGILSAKYGDHLKITIESLCPFVPWDFLGQHTIEIRFDRPARNFPKAPPSTPFQLSATGSPDRLGHSVNKTLAATATDINGDDLRFEFELKDQSDPYSGTSTRFSEWIDWTHSIQGSRGTVKQVLGPGVYKFRVRAHDKEGLFSEWSTSKTVIVPGAN